MLATPETQETLVRVVAVALEVRRHIRSSQAVVDTVPREALVKGQGLVRAAMRQTWTTVMLVHPAPAVQAELQEQALL